MYPLYNTDILWVETNLFKGGKEDVHYVPDQSYQRFKQLWIPVLFEWGYFSDHENSFPQELLDKLVERANLPGYTGQGATVAAV